MARTKPHAKVHVSVAHHPKTQEVWADPAQRGMLVEVWRLAVERYASKRKDVVRLTALDRLAITGATDIREADETLSTMLRALRYRVSRYENRWDVKIRNLSKKHGFRGSESDTDKPKKATHKKEERREKREESTHEHPKADGEELGATPPGYDQPNEVIRMLRLNSRATEAERSVWAESVWVEVVAAAQIESRDDGAFRDHFVKILSARWNAYLRERDPTKRAYAREARARELAAAKAALDTPRPQPNLEPDGDDPLRFLRSGGNPNVPN